MRDYPELLGGPSVITNYHGMKKEVGEEVYQPPVALEMD